MVRWLELEEQLYGFWSGSAGGRAVGVQAGPRYTVWGFFVSFGFLFLIFDKRICYQPLLGCA